ncbi:hypothetical protein GYB29_02345 [bacterium]|nr:hypothetical protein [Balneola sp.]MBR9916541.1 hypothetical protein [bacterium]
MRVLSLIFLFGFLISCSENQTFSPSEDIEFGAPYSIIKTSDMPAITNGILNSRVGYSGCNPDHEFELKSNTDNSVTEIWLFKKTSQQCEAYFEEEREFTLSESILRSDKIILITPSEERISLK